MTVDILRGDGVDNALYAYSPAVNRKIRHNI